MEPAFWHERWSRKEIAFHEQEANRMLVAFKDRLPSGRIFVPLCGKTRDIAYLLGVGFAVVGVELSSVAVRELFEELGVEPTIEPRGALECWSASDIDIFVGDIFDVTPALLGAVDATYDRAAMVALPKGMREMYAGQVATITNRAPQLAVCFEYNQALMDGPPFSIDAGELERLYGSMYTMAMLASSPLAGGLQSMQATEHAWLLTPRPEA